MSPFPTIQALEEKREQFHKEEPGYYLTITISGEPTYSKELMEHLKP